VSATDYVPDLRDIRFVLFEQLDIVGSMSPFPRYADLDQATAEQMVDEAARIVTEVLWPSNVAGDRIGCTHDGQGNVTTPPGFKEGWDTLAEGGWIGLSQDEQYGGLELPGLLDTVVQELIMSANIGFATYPALTKAAASLLSHYGPDRFRTLVVSKMVSGEWSGTMCLTESGAGTSVGDARTMATPTGDPGEYLIQGEKIFISAGDNDLAENIGHLVLARTPGAPAGTRGLSLFLVPKFRFDDEGRCGDRNDAFVQKIEEKMGLHGSATTVLAFGTQSEGALGYLLGEEGQGMPIMFHMMNEARIGTGLMGLATAATAYGLALGYATDRVQGTALKDMRKAGAEPVAIIEHPDVRRMLLHQKAHVETMRSFIYTLAMRYDQAEHTDDPGEKERLMGVVELMTPICKAHCSDRGYDVTVMAMQVFGGYGYTGEYPVEQCARDSKIASIWEGTNGVQALDLLGRKMRMRDGTVFMSWLQDAGREVARCKEIDALAGPAEAMEKALKTVGACAMHLSSLAQSRLEAAMLQATPFQEMMGTVVLGLHALEQARIASGKLEGDVSADDRRFYRGKVLGASFYASNVLPRAVALGKTIRSDDTSCLDPDLFPSSGA